MGVIALFVAILPRLAIGGREIFFAEASGPDDEKVSAADPPHGGTVVAALCRADGDCRSSRCWLTGMPLFDAIMHAFATLAAGRLLPAPVVLGRLRRTPRPSG